MKYIRITVILAALVLSISGQTTEFTYQGQLQSSSAAASGNFDFEFALFDGGGAQIGPTLVRNGVAVAGGVFTVNLDFGAGFPGATRFLEIRVRQAGGGAFTTLSPRQQVTSAPYSIKSLTANSADNAANATNALTATNFAGNLAGDVTGTQTNNTVVRLQNRNVASTPPLDGQVLKYNGAANQWLPGTDNVGGGGGGGTITGVTPGTGLNGGGTTGTVTIGIGPGGVGTGQLAEGSVVDSKIVTVSGAKVIGQVTDAFNATNAANATNSTQLGGIPSNQYLQTNGNGSGLTNLNASNLTTGTISNARIGQIATANIADAAVTGAKIGGGQVVKTLNGLTDNVTLAAGSNITLTPSGNTLTISSTVSGVSGSGIATTVPIWTGGTSLGNSVITQAGGNVGIGNNAPFAKLTVQASDTANGVDSFSAGGTGVHGTTNSVNGAGILGDNFSGEAVVGRSSGGFGVGAVVGRSDGAGYGVRGFNTSTGSGVLGQILSTGTGVAGRFENNNPANTSDVLLATGNGSGVTLRVNASNGANGIHVTQSGVGRGIFSSSVGGTGVSGTSTTGIGVVASASSQGAIALLTGGTSFFKGDTTPLTAANAGSGTGIAIGTSGTLGYVSAYDYSTNQTGTLLLNNSGGRVGINTNTPDQPLTVNGNASKPGGGSWLAFSDERLKNIKGPFTGGLKAVMNLQPLRYEYRKDNIAGVISDGEHIGFSAQEVEKVIPEAVTKTEQGIRLVNNDPIILAMLNAIKEQQATIEKLSRQVRQLQKYRKRR